MADITYLDKTEDTEVAVDDPRRNFSADDANEVKSAVNTKVDKVSGKELSTNDFTNTYKARLDNAPDDVNTELDGKVDKVAGKGLSDENYTSAEKTKLAGLSLTYVGTYVDLTALETAYPTGQAGYEAIIDGGAGSDPQKAFWDVSDEQWVIQTGGAASSFAELAGSPNDNVALAAALADKVDKVAGKGLSTNDYDATAKGKVDNLPANTTTALAAKADDSAVVKLTGDQTIAGVKEFTSGVRAFRESKEVTATSYTLVIGDRGLFLEANNASAQTLTIPPNADVAFAVDTEIEICRIGAGDVTIAPGSGVTLQSAGSRLRIAEQYDAIIIKKRATNTWRVIGALKS